MLQNKRNVVHISTGSQVLVWCIFHCRLRWNCCFCVYFTIFTDLYIVCHDGGNPWLILLIYYKFKCDSSVCCDSMIYHKLLLIKHCVAACCNDSCIILLLYVCVVCCHVYDHFTNVLANHLTVYGCSLVDICSSAYSGHDGHGSIAMQLFVQMFLLYDCCFVLGFRDQASQLCHKCYSFQ